MKVREIRASPPLANRVLRQNNLSRRYRPDVPPPFSFFPAPPPVEDSIVKVKDGRGGTTAAERRDRGIVSGRDLPFGRRSVGIGFRSL